MGECIPLHEPPGLVTSASLERYHEVCVKPAPLKELDGTWHALARWVRTHVPQEALVEVYHQLWDELAPISQAKDDTPEGRLADAIRNAGDVVWYAMDDDHLEAFEALVEQMTKAEKPPIR